MIGLPEAVVDGTEGGPGPTRAPPTTAAAELAGKRVPSRPDPAVSEKAWKREFGAEYKARILREADPATAPGQLGALLRREGLSSSHLAAWPKRCGRVPAARGPSMPRSGKRSSTRLTAGPWPTEPGRMPTPCIRNDSSAAFRSPQGPRPRSGSTRRKTWRSDALSSSRATLISSRRCLNVIDTFRALRARAIPRYAALRGRS